jgi:DNA repair photolyase
MMSWYPIDRIVLDETAAGYASTTGILKKMKDIPVFYHSEVEETIGQDRDLGKTTLHLLAHKGEILKPCPGTREYICCGYQILHMAANCPLDCSYCILQSYFNQPNLRVFVNLEERLEEVFRRIDGDPDRIFRIGTGEFTDSLALDPILHWTTLLVPGFSKRNNVVLELKTKTDNIGTLLSAPGRDRIIVSWSLNSPEMTIRNEHRAASIRKRLEAARECQREGFVLGFHFDPLVPHENWREGYLKTLELMDKYIDPKGIIWISMGSFRFLPQLKRVIQRRHAHNHILDGEFVPGLDGKMRYFRPIRMALYDFMRKRLEEWQESLGLYLCMESHDVWSESMGWSPQNSAGLSRYLDERVRKLFG